MLEDSLKKQPVEFSCPQCGRKIKVTLQDLQSKKQITCPHCRTAINLKVTGELDQLFKSAKKFDNTLRKFK